MLEKHATNPPPGFSGSNNVHTVMAPMLPPPIIKLPPPPPKPAVDFSGFATYAAHWGPGFDPNAAATAAVIPIQPPGMSEPLPDPEDTLNAVAEAVPCIDSNAEVIDKVEADKTDDVDPEELAMLGIDPTDFSAFGK